MQIICPRFIFLLYGPEEYRPNAYTISETTRTFQTRKTAWQRIKLLETGTATSHEPPIYTNTWYTVYTLHETLRDAPPFRGKVPWNKN